VRDGERHAAAGSDDTPGAGTVTGTAGVIGETAGDA
jgi:hypothetical protein